MKVKLKTSASHKFGQKNQVPYAGLISFDEKGETEVDLSENDLNSLLVAIPDLSIVGDKKEKVQKGKNVVNDPIKPQTVQNDIGKGDEGEDSFGNDDDTDPALVLADLTKEDLISVAVENKLPKKEWKDLNEEELRKYLVEKASE